MPKWKEGVLNVKNSKQALLIGLNYPGKDRPLDGCINDVTKMKQCLVNKYGFFEGDITVLIDTDPSCILPTRDNILLALYTLVYSAEPGDILFVYFSGHGGRLPSNDEDDDTGFDEFIITSDEKHITDDDFKKIVNSVPMGCRITMLSDSCHSGGLIEAAKEQIGNSTKERYRNSRAGFEFCNFFPEGYIHVNYRSRSPSAQIDAEQQIGEDAGAVVNLGMGQTQQETHFPLRMGSNQPTPLESIFGPSEGGEPDFGILLSACQSDQQAGEGKFDGNSEVYGAFTHTILGIIEENHGPITHRDLVLKVGRKLWQKGIRQEPGLYCSDHHADVYFLL